MIFDHQLIVDIGIQFKSTTKDFTVNNPKKKKNKQKERETERDRKRDREREKADKK